MAKIAVFDAKEIADKLTLLNQYCDIEIAEDATFGDLNVKKLWLLVWLHINLSGK